MLEDDDIKWEVKYSLHSQHVLASHHVKNGRYSLHGQQVLASNNTDNGRYSLLSQQVLAFR